jgi:hypothetical protein
MNVTNLIDAIVRQTSVLLAQLATSGGDRAQLANTANQVFLDLVEALREQGLGSRVIADMFGLALRTYQEQGRRLSESRTVRGKSLWEAVLEHVQSNGPILRADVLTRFRYYDVDEWTLLLNADVHQVESLAELGVATALPEDALGHALERLVSRELTSIEAAAGETRYTSSGGVLPFDDPKGWEAAVFDHYQAMVGALVAKLNLGTRGASLSDVIGGSTFGFEVWPGHPHYDEVRGLLHSFRQQCRDLRERVGHYNQATPAPAHCQRVISYVGQSILDDLSEEHNDDEIY